MEIRIASGASGGSTVTISGVGDTDTITRLQGVLMVANPGGWAAPPLGGFGGPPPQPAGGPPLSPDGRYWWDGTQWRLTSPPDNQAPLQTPA
jgi:hypothetical protein